MEQLIDEFMESEKKGFYEYTLRSRYLQDFSPIIDPDLISQDDVVGYMRDHVQKIIRTNKDATPALDQWLSGEVVENMELNDNKMKLRLEYLTLLAERMWLQTIHTSMM